MLTASNQLAQALLMGQQDFMVCEHPDVSDELLKTHGKMPAKMH